MKRLMLTIIVTAGIAGAASAQTTGSNSSVTTPAVSSRGSATVAPNGNSRSLKYSKLNQREIYHWNSGQRATPTGEQATSVNGGYAALEQNNDAANVSNSNVTNSNDTNSSTTTDAGTNDRSATDNTQTDNQQ